MLEKPVNEGENKMKLLQKLKVKMNTLLVKKNEGFGDMVASLIVLVALSIIVLVYVGSIGDIQTKISVDQIARKYILRMETTGTLTTEDRAACIAELKNIGAIKDDSIQITTNPATASYGQSISLTIECKANMTAFTWEPHKPGFNQLSPFGHISRTKEQTIISTKQSTAKY